MRIAALIKERDVIERILRRLGRWEPRVRAVPARDPPGEVVIPDGSDPPSCPVETGTTTHRSFRYGFPLAFRAGSSDNDLRNLTS